MLVGELPDPILTQSDKDPEEEEEQPEVDNLVIDIPNNNDDLDLFAQDISPVSGKKGIFTKDDFIE